MEYIVHCKSNEEVAFLDAIIKMGMCNIKTDWLKKEFPNLESYKFSITYKTKDKPKKRKPKQLPGQLDMFDVIDKENKDDNQ